MIKRIRISIIDQIEITNQQTCFESFAFSFKNRSTYVKFNLRVPRLSILSIPKRKKKNNNNILKERKIRMIKRIHISILND